MTQLHNKLQRRLARLELVHLDSMLNSVADFYRRLPSKAKWNVDLYPTGSEKELYAEFAHIILADPPGMIDLLFRLLDTPIAKELRESCMAGSWRAYRLSTIRRDRGMRWQGPECFPGAAGHGAIADVGLFLNPSYGVDSYQIDADFFLYFEIKSSDAYAHSRSQLAGHLAALELELPEKKAFLVALGGKDIVLDHPRWAGHTTLGGFFAAAKRYAAEQLRDEALVAEINGLLVRKQR